MPADHLQYNNIKKREDIIRIDITRTIQPGESVTITNTNAASGLCKYEPCWRETCDAYYSFFIKEMSLFRTCGKISCLFKFVDPG